jgi:hypothetical protein
MLGWQEILKLLWMWPFMIFFPFISLKRIAICSTIGPSGDSHLMSCLQLSFMVDLEMSKTP